jgi:hypothetical protein
VIFIILFKKHDITNLISSEWLSEDTPPYYLLLILFLFCIGLVIYSPSLSGASTLNASRDVAGLGIMFKLATTIIPALSFTILTIYPKAKIAYFSIILSLLVSCYGAAVFLTKQPIFPYLLFGIALFPYLKGKLKLACAFIFIALLMVVVFIYVNREGETLSVLFIVERIVFRFPLILELGHIIEYLTDSDALWEFNSRLITGEITDKVFGYNPKAIGIAPGFIGYFIINFGYIFPVFLFLFLFYFLASLNLFKNNNVLDRLFYFLIVCEFLSFFNDGSLTFYTSTSNGMFFYFLILGGVGITALKFFKSEIK